MNRIIGESAAILESDFVALATIRDRTILWGNRAMHRLFGYTDGELVGLPTRALFIDDEDYDDFDDRVHPIISRGQTYNGEHRQQRRDGSRGWFQFSVSLLAGDPHTFVACIVDVTAQQEARDRLTDILTNISDGVSVISTSGVILYTNRAMDLMFGYEPGALLGQPVHVLNADSEQSPGSVAKAILDHLNEHGRWEGDVLNRRSDGSSFWTSARVVRHQSPAWGQAWFSVQRDISDRKALENALRDSNLKLALAINVTGLGTWEYDFRTGCVTADDNFLNMLGFKAGDLSSDSESFLGLVHPEDRADVEAVAAAHLKGELAVYESEHRLRHRNGHFVWHVSVGQVVERGSDGSPVRMVGTNRDISLHKRLTRESVALMHHIEQLIANVGSGTAMPQRDATRANLAEQLTKRQRQILKLIAAGLTSADIAKRLHLATGTVIAHRRNLMGKLDLHSTADVTRFAIECGLVGDG